MKIRSTAALAASVALATGMLVSAGTASAEGSASTTRTAVAPAAFDTLPAGVAERLADLNQAPRLTVRTGSCDLSPDADCKGKDMRHYKKKMKGKDMSGSDMSNSDMRGMDLRGTDFTNANLSGAKLDGAKMDGAILDGAYMRSAKLEGANLKGADLKRTQIMGGNFKNANFTGADLSGVVVMKGDFRGAKFTDVKQSTRSSGITTRLGGAYMVFNGSNFNGTVWDGVNAFSATFTDTSWKNVRITNSDFRTAYFSGETHWFWTVTIIDSQFNAVMFGPDIEAARSVSTSDFRFANCFGKRAGEAWGSQYSYGNLASNTNCIVRGLAY
jgi:uncharacterized protein YjbI with pentapeptide repeats